MSTTPAFHRLLDALKAGDAQDEDTLAALNHLQAAENAMLRIGMLLTSCTDRPREVLDYVADTFTDYVWGARPGRGGGRDESGTGPAERWLFEATDDQPMIYAAQSDVMEAQGIDDVFHPREDVCDGCGRQLDNGDDRTCDECEAGA